MTDNKHVFIIGSKGIPAQYGGFETFVDELISRRKNEKICYHVACAVDEKKEAEEKPTCMYKGVECFSIYRPSIGSARAIIYDLYALEWCIDYIEKYEIKEAIVYILACRIGPFMKKRVDKLKKMGAKIYLNPDGHEWKREKWNYFVKQYWKLSERKMIAYADKVICDSKNIQKYVLKVHKKAEKDTCFIPYGADLPRVVTEEQPVSKKLMEWYKKWGLESGEYYLIVGRFVQENNFETMLREFTESDTKKKLCIITNADSAPRFYKKLREVTNFIQDDRIIFVGTVYDRELLLEIRQRAFAYLHGHEVGGTNPSLLEALGATSLNLLLKVSFNMEVGEKAALYWTKEKGSLKKIIERAEHCTKEEILRFGSLARERIETDYNWPMIIKQYEELFLEDNKEA